MRSYPVGSIPRATSSRVSKSSSVGGIALLDQVPDPLGHLVRGRRRPAGFRMEKSSPRRSSTARAMSSTWASSEASLISIRTGSSGQARTQPAGRIRGPPRRPPRSPRSPDCRPRSPPSRSSSPLSPSSIAAQNWPRRSSMPRSPAPPPPRRSPRSEPRSPPPIGGCQLLLEVGDPGFGLVEIGPGCIELLR